MRILFAVLSLAYFLSIAAVRTCATPLIGYGSADAVLPAKTQEVIYLGFELGLALKLGRNDVSDLIAIEHSWTGSPLGAQVSSQKLVERGVVALVGFPSSHDALLASQISKKAGVMAVFAADRHAALATLGPLVTSTVPSLADDIEKMMAFIQKKYPGKHGLLISDPYNVFSKNQEEIFSQLLKGERFSGVKITVLRVDAERRLRQSDLKRIQLEKFDYFYLTGYPDQSVHVLEQLATFGLDKPIFANGSWVSDDYELIRRFLIRRKSPTYSISPWNRNSKQWRNFQREFRKRYGREAPDEAACGFDLGMIVGSVINRSKKQLTKENFISEFYSQSCFEESASGLVCFPAHGGHAQRQQYIVRFSEGGFVPMASVQDISQ